MKGVRETLTVLCNFGQSTGFRMGGDDITNLACFQGFRQWALKAKYRERKEEKHFDERTSYAAQERIMMRSQNKAFKM